MSKSLALLTLFVATAADLPVTKVVVYKNGVAYFERAGDVKSGEPARLEFKAAEMDDVLKSLVIEDRSGGKVRSLRYELNEPVSKRLGELPLNLPAQQPLALLLDQLKGARAEFRVGSGVVTGAIVGGRMAALPQQGQRQEVTLLLDSGELRVLDLETVSSMKLLDPALQRQLGEALSLLSQARNRDKRAVLIEGEGARRLTARYLVPAAVWKSSYRLIFPETGDPTLEGWAIVDNSSGEDWNNVELTVVSGRPVSFVTRLYDPKYLERPRAELAEDMAVRPVVYSGNVVGSLNAASARSEVVLTKDEALESGVRRKAGAIPPAKRAPAPAPALMMMTPSTAEVATETRDAGELFEYRFSAPVNAKKGESAAIPFVQQPINARRLLVYSDRSSINPRSAAELSNNTGKTLDGGPLTIYQSGSYGGEALMETLKAGDKRLISFAVDLGTRVTTNFESGQNVIREIRATRGILTTRTAIERTTTYSATNIDARDKTLIIEHPVAPNMKILRPKPDETTANQYRFAVKLTAKSTSKLAVVEEDLIEETEAVSSFTPDALFAIVQNRTLSATGRKQLEAIAAKKRELADAANAGQRAEAEISEIVKDQDRIRQNLNSLNRVSGQQDLVQRYVTQLSQGDTQLAQLRDRQAEQRKRAMALQAEVNAMIEKLEF
jgi:hypothetical protein